MFPLQMQLNLSIWIKPVINAVGIWKLHKLDSIKSVRVFIAEYQKILRCAFRLLPVDSEHREKRMGVKVKFVSVWRQSTKHVFLSISLLLKCYKYSLGSEPDIFAIYYKYFIQIHWWFGL